MIAKNVKPQQGRSRPLISPLAPSAAIVGRQRELKLVMNLYEAAKHGQVAVVSSVLASLFPELTMRLGDLGVPSASPPEQARLRLFEAIGAFLEAIGTPHGLVLILDDLQWADSDSLDLLCHLARRQSHVRLLVLGTYRESELALNPALARTVAELARQRRLTTVEVGPLSAQEIVILASMRLGAPLSPEASTLLYRQSEGNPFFAEDCSKVGSR